MKFFMTVFLGAIKLDYIYIIVSIEKQTHSFVAFVLMSFKEEGAKKK